MHYETYSKYAHAHTKLLIYESCKKKIIESGEGVPPRFNLKLSCEAGGVKKKHTKMYDLWCIQNFYFVHFFELQWEKFLRQFNLSPYFEGT